MNRLKVQSVLPHFVLWTIYLLFKIYHEFVWIYPFYPDLGLLGAFKSASLGQISTMGVKIAFSYWFIYDFMGTKRKVFVQVAYFLVMLGLALSLYRLAIVYIALPWAYADIPEQQRLFSMPRITLASIDLALISGITSSLVLYQRQKKAQRRAQDLEKEKLDQELRFLKQQTNPHFLFNTLNNLYALARKNSPQTAEAILELSNLMRFMLYEVSQDSISLDQELHIIEQYVHLEKLRYGGRLQVHLNIPKAKDLEEYRLAPLLLMPLVENAFKHGASESEEGSQIWISLELERLNLDFKVQNTLNQSQVAPSPKGLGLKNLQRQLELQYLSYDLDTRQEEGLFKAHLRLKIEQNANTKMLNFRR